MESIVWHSRNHSGRTHAMASCTRNFSAWLSSLVTIKWKSQTTCESNLKISPNFHHLCILGNKIIIYGSLIFLHENQLCTTLWLSSKEILPIINVLLGSSVSAVHTYVSFWDTQKLTSLIGRFSSIISEANFTSRSFPKSSRAQVTYT